MPYAPMAISSEVGRPRAGAFTVLELLTTLALIVIVMGLMVSLARYVRANSADRLTRTVLIDLDRALDEYHKKSGAFPEASVIKSDLSEQQMAAYLQESNRQVVEELRSVLTVPETTVDGAFLQVVEGGAMARDAWGRTIGYLSRQHPSIGMAPQNGAFFFSAGPDGQYLTRQDNLYSYEQVRAEPLLAGPEKMGHASSGN